MGTAWRAPTVLERHLSVSLEPPKKSEVKRMGTSRRKGMLKTELGRGPSLPPLVSCC